MESTIRLFKAVPIEKKKSKVDKDVLKRTIKLGFILSPEVVGNYKKCDEVIKNVEKNIGISADKVNSSFHKSWAKVRDASDEQLVTEQILHYITTYGFESAGIYDEDSVYIPNETLDLPKDNIDKLKLEVIHGYTKAEIKEKLLSLLSSGIALKKETIDDVLDVSLMVGLNEDEVSGVRNKEVKAALYNYLNLIPKNPTEFLRFVIYQTTATTLIIKSPVLIKAIKEGKGVIVNGLFKRYESGFGNEGLASIFYRFKPLFLAFRLNADMKKRINKIRRLAVKHHKPMPEDYLNNVTSKIKNGVSLKDLRKELVKVNTFRKIRLAYALNYRCRKNSSIVYKVRNGKGFAADFAFHEQEKAGKALKIVLKSISNDVRTNIKGKKIYIPKFIEYCMPATEKQFTGNFPSGTCVRVPRDMIFGIHWNNVEGHRIDLDLSLIDNKGDKFGWDSYYRSDNRGILFSGDMTDAQNPKGASELFYAKKQKQTNGIMTVNYFNYEENVSVPYKIIIASEMPKNFKENYTVNPKNIVVVLQSEISVKQKLLGLVVVNTKESRFYFSETSVGNSITAYNSKPADQSRNYLFNFYTHGIELRQILELAGAKLVEKPEDCDLDLSPASLDKSSIINLFRKVKD